MAAADIALLRAQVRAHLRALAEDGLWGVPRARNAAYDPAAATTATTSAAPAAPASPPAPPIASGAAGIVTVPSADALATLAEEVRGCIACGLHRGRTQVVVGVGNARARLMFIGEGPGREEDLRGEPFVGAAGELLDKMILAMGLQRQEVYIANAVKCRPPNNRNPEPDELDACRPFLLRQIEAVRPEVIVLLGRVATQSLLSTTAPLARLRGRFLEFAGVPVMCTYHPAFLLRQPENKRAAWEDLQKVMGLLAGAST